MNAYELAEIMEVHDGSQVWEHGLEIANMLRQQAKEKELLQNQSSELAKEVMYFQEQNRQQADRIAELERQNDNYWVMIEILRQKVKANTTPQTNPLSDEERKGLQGEIATLKHMNKNWSISEGWALQEIELMKHFLQENQLYLSFQEWKHSDSARAIEAKVRGEK